MAFTLAQSKGQVRGVLYSGLAPSDHGESNPHRQRLQKRWSIEVLFSALKKRAFDFEHTHLTDPERIKKLVALLAIAFTWAHLVGVWLAEKKPLKIKKHGYREQSLFRYGLDHLQYLLLNIQQQMTEFYHCVWLLICPPETDRKSVG